MRIGFCGSQGTGKTTLLKQMIGWPEFNGYVFISGMTRAAKVPLNGDGNFEGQKTLVRKMSWRLKAEENIIVDRTLLDMFAYSCWMRDEGKITTQQLNYVRARVRAHQHLFDIVFYIRPEFSVIGDGVRSGDQGYALAVAAEMERIVKHESLNTKRIVTLTGTVEERLTQIKEVLRNGVESRT